MKFTERLGAVFLRFRPRSPGWRRGHSSAYAWQREGQESPNAPILITAAAFLMLFAVASADVLLGTQFSVLLFYLVPIAWAAWQAGQNPALIVATFCAFARFGVEIVEDVNRHFWRPQLMWSISTELLFFLVFVGLLLKVHSQLDAERALARTDGLTGLHNARAFEMALTGERERLRRYGRTLTLIYFDLDNFKTVNDRMGHAAGDELLKTVARTLAGNIRQVDVASRLGGDEFALLLPETGAEGAAVVVHRLRERMLAALAARGWPVTCSFGCVTFVAAPENFETMLRAADAAMYRAKTAGKNRVEDEIWGVPVAQTIPHSDASALSL